MNIIITGTSRGIGYETLKYLSESGNHKILAISRNTKPINELIQAEGKLKSEIISKSIDLKNEFNFFSEIDEVFGLSDGSKIDLLINNAGLLINKPFDNLSMDEWHDTFSLNLFSIVNIIKMLLPYFNKSGGAHIVNIGSMGGYQGAKKFKGLTAYSASKSALHALTESLAVEMSDKNISVNALALGSVKTEMFKNAFPNAKANVTAEKMAKYIGDFALNSSQLMNGKIIPVSISK